MRDLLNYLFNRAYSEFKTAYPLEEPWIRIQCLRKKEKKTLREVFSRADLNKQWRSSISDKEAYTHVELPAVIQIPIVEIPDKKIRRSGKVVRAECLPATDPIFTQNPVKMKEVEIPQNIRDDVLIEICNSEPNDVTSYAYYKEKMLVEKTKIAVWDNVVREGVLLLKEQLDNSKSVIERYDKLVSESDKMQEEMKSKSSVALRLNEIEIQQLVEEQLEQVVSKAEKTLGKKMTMGSIIDKYLNIQEKLNKMVKITNPMFKHYTDEIDFPQNATFIDKVCCLLIFMHESVLMNEDIVEPDDEN
jgi:hypothetical protein